MVYKVILIQKYFSLFSSKYLIKKIIDKENLIQINWSKGPNEVVESGYFLNWKKIGKNISDSQKTLLYLVIFFKINPNKIIEIKLAMMRIILYVFKDLNGPAQNE